MIPGVEMTFDRNNTPNLKQHNITLEGKTSRGLAVKLRPQTENDWDALERWNNDPEVLYYSDGDDVTFRSPEEVRYIYRSVSQNAFCFMIEADGREVGECWLQQMNLPRVLQMFPGLDCRRIDLMIGEKAQWSQGIGSAAICLLTDFGFAAEKADIIYNPEIADYNIRIQKAFQKVGYQIAAEIPQPPGSKAQKCIDLKLTREDWLKEPYSRRTRYQGAIVVDHHILLIKHREHRTGRAYWVMPGGGIDSGETEEECVRREMQEETNLDVRVISLLLNEPALPGNLYQQYKTYLCEPVTGEASPGGEPEPSAASWYSISAVKWFDLRSEAEWDPLLVNDPITYLALQSIRRKLGYLTK